MPPLLPSFDSITITLTPQRSSTSSSAPSLVRNLVLTADKPVVVIGRASRNDAQNRSEQADNALFDCPVISRRHAEIHLNRSMPWEDSLSLLDVHSLHGTTVNGVAVEKGRKFALRSNDVVKFGQRIMRGHETHDAVMVTFKCFEPPVIERAKPTSTPVELERSLNRPRSFCVPSRSQSPNADGGSNSDDDAHADSDSDMSLDSELQEHPFSAKTTPEHVKGTLGSQLRPIDLEDSHIGELREIVQLDDDEYEPFFSTKGVSKYLEKKDAGEAPVEVRDSFSEHPQRHRLSRELGIADNKIIQDTYDLGKRIGDMNDDHEQGLEYESYGDDSSNFGGPHSHISCMSSDEDEDEQDTHVEDLLDAEGIEEISEDHAVLDQPRSSILYPRIPNSSSDDKVVYYRGVSKWDVGPTRPEDAFEPFSSMSTAQPVPDSLLSPSAPLAISPTAGGKDVAQSYNGPSDHSQETKKSPMPYIYGDLLFESSERHDSPVAAPTVHSVDLNQSTKSASGGTAVTTKHDTSAMAIPNLLTQDSAQSSRSGAASVTSREGDTNEVDGRNPGKKRKAAQAIGETLTSEIRSLPSIADLVNPIYGESAQHEEVGGASPADDGRRESKKPRLEVKLKTGQSDAAFRQALKKTMASRRTRDSKQQSRAVGLAKITAAVTAGVVAGGAGLMAFLCSPAADWALERLA